MTPQHSYVRLLARSPQDSRFRPLPATAIEPDNATLVRTMFVNCLRGQVSCPCFRLNLELTSHVTKDNRDLRSLVQNNGPIVVAAFALAYKFPLISGVAPFENIFSTATTAPLTDSTANIEKIANIPLQALRTSAASQDRIILPQDRLST